jgi:hypothetical protein
MLRGLAAMFVCLMSLVFMSAACLTHDTLVMSFVFVLSVFISIISIVNAASPIGVRNGKYQ